MTTTGGKAFVDTNVLLRAFNDPLPHHLEAKSLVYHYLDANTELWISRQIIREYLVQVTHPRSFPQTMTVDVVLNQLKGIQEIFKVADETAEVTTQLLDLLKTYPTGGKQVHDANIVATMLVNGVDTLLTMNVANFRRFEDRITLVPLGLESSS